MVGKDNRMPTSSYSKIMGSICDPQSNTQSLFLALRGVEISKYIIKVLLEATTGVNVKRITNPRALSFFSVIGSFEFESYISTCRKLFLITAQSCMVPLQKESLS
eukprot:TRINITY_DN723_c0_g1_i2.p1 TRINITY_DN723_c0_g1~~TRINITY_DN723_c0_g1_i2.p1  ORF type:complete len:105 (-),score=14.70 TRINITY_DN723_c0_g1_i2:1041-1355(-)